MLQWGGNGYIGAYNATNGTGNALAPDLSSSSASLSNDCMEIIGEKITTCHARIKATKPGKYKVYAIQNDTEVADTTITVTSASTSSPYEILDVNFYAKFTFMFAIKVG